MMMLDLLLLVVVHLEHVVALGFGRGLGCLKRRQLVYWSADISTRAMRIMGWERGMLLMLSL
jgi:hypothetical protein